MGHHTKCFIAFAPPSRSESASSKLRPQTAMRTPHILGPSPFNPSLLGAEVCLSTIFEVEVL
jgi:hypothetical protein